MASTIDEPSLSINHQIANGSKSSLLMSQIEFKPNDDEDDCLSNKYFQSKYNVLTPDKVVSNLNEIKFNGQIKNANIFNGNRNDNAIDGLLNPKIMICPKEKVHLEWKQTHKIGAGLVNLGNTCFMNSVLQCLTYCPPLVNFLLYDEEDHLTKCILNTFCMICDLARHIKRVYGHSGDAIRPVYIYQRLKLIAKHFTFGRQEDAHEFLRYVIDNMWKACLTNFEHNNNFKLDHLSKETTIINHIFGGYHRSQVICLHCNEKSNTYDYFMDFMLDIKNAVNLEGALHKFVQPEILQQENAYKCTRCKRKVPAKKLFTVYRAPNVATFQLKRFDYNRIFGGKITKLISYPDKLDLRPFMSDKQGPPILYKLNAVLVHLGPTCNSGHYFCYVKNSSGCWYLMDDSRVSQVNLNQVLNQQAYILFYVRINSDFNKPNSFKYCSSTQLSGMKTTPFSSPELSHPKSGMNFNLHNGISSLNSSGKTFSQSFLNNSNLEIKRPSMTPPKSKPLEQPSLPLTKKGLVPYTSDSSDEETTKDDEDKAGDKDITKKNDVLKENTSSSSQEKASLQNINSKPNNFQYNSLPEINNVSVPLTMKVKATTSSWHVIETSLRSPSVASGSSTNSVNSTTEWTVTDSGSEIHHSKLFNHHSKLKNKCTSNNNVHSTSTKGVITQNGNDKNEGMGMDNKDNKSSVESSSKTEQSILKKLDNESEAALKDKSEKDDIVSSKLHEEKVDKVNDEIQDSKQKGNGNEKTNVSPVKEKKEHKHKISNGFSDSDSDSEYKKLKKKRKKKKKKKHKKKHRTSSSSDESSSNEDNQLEWVERTKETMEKEHKHITKSEHIKHWDEGVRDLTGKRKRNDESSDNHQREFEFNQSFDIPLRGYTDKINSWDGGPSHLNTFSKEENHRSYSYDDQYNNDFDKGKNKKVKLRHHEDSLYHRQHNPFQKAYSFKHHNNGKYYDKRKSWDKRSKFHSGNHYNYK